MSDAMALEKNQIKLGFIALLDCAPLVVAREKGFFEKYGLNVILNKESSWASVRDKVSFGLLDGAHMLAPMPLAATLGLNGNKTPMITAIAISQNGTAITLSNTLYDQVQANLGQEQLDTSMGDAFKAAITQCSQKPVIATVYPYSNHHYQLHYWLAQHQIDTTEDIKVAAIPPAQMLENLEAQRIDGYCVGEPWNSLALKKDIGSIAITGHEVWGSHMEKVLGVTQAWADEHPNTHKALVNGLYEACQWAEASENREELMQLLALPPYLDIAAEQLAQMEYPAFTDQHFGGEGVNEPAPQHGLFILEQMEECGQLDDLDIDQSQVVNQVYRADLYKQWIR